MKKYADRKRRDVELQVNDLVFLKIRPYRQISVRSKRNEKLAPKFFGPFKILEKIGTVAYRLELPSAASIHPVFHVSQLKKALGNHEKVQHLVPYVNGKYEWLTQPEEIFGYQKNPNIKEWEVLISWKGLPPHEATWEDCQYFKQQFPDFQLEDKVALEVESNARSPIFITYSRKKKGKDRITCGAGGEGKGQDHRLWGPLVS